MNVWNAGSNGTRTTPVEQAIRYEGFVQAKGFEILPLNCCSAIVVTKTLMEGSKMTTATTTKPQVTIPKDGAPTQQVISPVGMVNFLTNHQPSAAASQDDGVEKGCQFVGLHTNIDADTRMNKTNCLKGKDKAANPYMGKGYRKVAHTTFMVQFSYDDSVVRRSDGTDSAANNGNYFGLAVVRDDGSRTALTVHKKDVDMAIEDRRYYMAGEYRKSKSHFIDADGNIVDDATAAKIKTYWKKSKSAWVGWQTPSLANVIKVTINHVTYILDHS